MHLNITRRTITLTGEQAEAVILHPAAAAELPAPIAENPFTALFVSMGWLEETPAEAPAAAPAAVPAPPAPQRRAKAPRVHARKGAPHAR